MDYTNFKKFGWTSVIIEKNNNMSCVLVKKNLFKGYKVIDVKGNVFKTDDLSFLNDSNVISSSFSISKDLNSFKNVNNAFNIKNNQYNEDINKLNSDIENLKSEASETIRNLESNLRKVEEEYASKAKSEKRKKIEFLNSSLTKFFKVKCFEEGYEVVDEPINDLQRSIGMTCNPQKKYYSKEYNCNWSMRDYLEIVSETIDNEYKEEIRMLLTLYNKLMGNISVLEVNFNDELYAKTVGILMNFTNGFSSFIKSWYLDKGNNDLSYYKSSNRYGTGDEKVNFSYKSFGLINQGVGACSKLIEKIYDEEEKNNFLTSINSIINNHDFSLEEDKKTR